MNLRRALTWKEGTKSAWASVKLWCEQDFLDLLDFILYVTRGATGAALEGVLSHGSAWSVAPDACGLSRRVLPEVADSAHDVVATGGNAGALIGTAWRHVYGRDPAPGTGYREAVRAIEAASCHVVLPKDPTATLGKVIKALKDAPAGKYVTVFPPNAVGGNPLESVRKLMELVWTSQLDRHGTADESVPLSVTQEQAEAALGAAVTLVQWFQRGFVRLGP